jgi:hypothetical protein
MVKKSTVMVVHARRWRETFRFELRKKAMGLVVDEDLRMGLFAGERGVYAGQRCSVINGASDKWGGERL